MQDKEIVDLYWARNESAITETGKKYGNYLTKIAYNILSDMEDSKETVNDTYMKAWDTIPPNRPVTLSLFLARIARFIAIDRLRMKTSQKRNGSQYTCTLSELNDCTSAGNITEEKIDQVLLSDTIASFLKSVSDETRAIFVGRYFFMDSIKEISRVTGFSESKVKVQLHRARLELKEYLREEGYDV